MKNNILTNVIGQALCVSLDESLNRPDSGRLSYLIEIYHAISLEYVPGTFKVPGTCQDPLRRRPGIIPHTQLPHDARQDNKQKRHPQCSQQRPGRQPPGQRPLV